MWESSEFQNKLWNSTTVYTIVFTLVFHFLTERSDRVNYINQILKSTKENSYVIISVFSYEGPKTCSSLPVKQYNENSLSSELGGNFKILKFSYHDHLTPTNKKQNFISCCFKIIN